MKRRRLNRQPGLGDFKNKCSEIVKKYDGKIMRTIYETTYEYVQWKGSNPRYVKKDILPEIEAILKKQKISVLHLNEIVIEILAYLGKFLILLDSDKFRQN